jgi:hypothetical protein
MWARAVPYGEFGRLWREAPVAWSAGEVVYEHFITGLTADVLDRMPPRGEAFDFVDAVAEEAHRVQVRPDPAPERIASAAPPAPFVRHRYGLKGPPPPFGPCRERGEGALAPIYRGRGPLHPSLASGAGAEPGRVG